ncbi:NIPSNAP family protein [Actinoallomurus acanthiterrae]
MYADLTTLSCEALEVANIASALTDVKGSPELPGELRGVWITENGVLGEVIMVRTFADLDELFTDHRDQYLKKVPFGLVNGVRGFRMRAHEVFDFADILPPGEHGAIYEIRTYELKVGGLAPTLAGWRGALPRRMPRSPLAIGMSSLDGAPSITHIWPFSDANERMRLRAELYDENLWPPEDGPQSIDLGTSTIALPATFSPWR